MQIPKRWKAVGPVTAAMLVFSSVAPGLAEEATPVEEGQPTETEQEEVDEPAKNAGERRADERRRGRDDDGEAELSRDGLEFQIEIDRTTVMVGDPIEVEVEYEVEFDEAEEEDESEEETEADESESDEGSEDESDVDTGQSQAYTPADAHGDGTGSSEDEADAPAGDTAADDTVAEENTEPQSSITFTVDYGDGTVEDLALSKEKSKPGEEYEAEAVGTHVYETEGSYTVTVTATPDTGDAVTLELPVEATTDPVAYARKPKTACPEDGIGTAGAFSDVAPGSTHEAMIDCLSTRGLVRGPGNGTFAPGVKVSRAQMATFLVRMLEEAGVELPETVEDAFDDDDGNTHEDAINQLAAAGLLAGSTDGKVSPSAPLTRAQMAALLVRVLQEAGLELGAEFDYFLDDDGTVHEESINLAAAAGVGSGRAIGEFDPGAQLSRAQLATFLARALDLLLETGEAATA